MTNRLLGADGISAVLEAGGGNVLVVNGSAGSLTGNILFVDGVSDLLLADGVSAALLSGGAGGTPGDGCQILQTDGASAVLLANGSDHLLLFDCIPTAPGDGCRILKADGSALLLANGVDHLLLFDCVPADVTPPPPATDTISPGGLSSSTKRTHRPVYVDAFSRIKRQPVEEPPAKSIEPQAEPKPVSVPFKAPLSDLGQANYADIIAQMQREAQQAAQLLKRKQDDEAIALLLLS